MTCAVHGALGSGSMPAEGVRRVDDLPERAGFRAARWLFAEDEARQAATMSAGSAGVNSRSIAA